MTRVDRFVCVGIMLAGLTAGCSIAGDRPPVVATQIPPLETPAPATEGSGRTAAEGAIEYTRSGGFAGTSEAWVLHADGRVTDAGGAEYLVSQSDVDELLTEFERLGFYDWNVAVPLPNQCADCFTYSIRVTQPGISNQISFIDAQQGVPDAVWTLLERIQALLATKAEKADS